MKKRVIAVALAALLALNLCSLRPKAAAGGAAIVAGIGILAFNLLGVMTGRYDDVAEGIGCFIDNGVEGWQNAFVGSGDTPSWFASGWEQIYNTCNDWFNSGAISMTDDGKVKMTYTQYLELCGMIGDCYASFDVELHTDIPYKIFKIEQGIYYHLDQTVSVNSIDEAAQGSTYAPVYYTSDKIYFPSSVMYINFRPWTATDATAYCYCFFSINNDLATGYYDSSESTMWLNGYYDHHIYTDFYTDADINMSVSGNTINYSWLMSMRTKTSASHNVNWYSYDGTAIAAESPPSSASLGWLNCRGKYKDFITSISSYTAADIPAEVDDLSDELKNILTKTKDPTLEIDTDPAIVSPADAVTVTDIPGEADVTLSQLRENTRLDIDIPSVIADKFPFCIPFDFIRIISVLCADPVAPVFRIPISTDPENLKGFEGNQTIGDYPEDFEPMFEIDEEIIIDLSAMPLVQPVCYTIFIISFVVLLIFSTNKLINH